MKRKINRLVYVSSALVVAGSLLGGCGTTEPVSPSDSLPQAGSSGVDNAEKGKQEQEREEADQKKREAERIASLLSDANRAASSYDYSAALDLLAGEEDPAAIALRSKISSAKTSAVAWPEPDQVPHLFFHSLIVDPERAFDGDSDTQGYLDYMVTKHEFEAILAQLHERGFVLVRPHDIARIENGVMTYQEILLPPGKKPLVISEDDVSYYEYMEGDGFADRLVVDSNGAVVNEYTDADGNILRGAYDMPPIVDAFVEANPDFSYRGAKGILALTGYNGVFGYRTSARQYPDSPTLQDDTKSARAVAQTLSDDGWMFASHAWGHINVTDSSLARLERDSTWWDEEVKPILGATDQYIYPFGADISDVKKYRGEKFELLKSHGFDYFYGVDGTTYSWMQQGKEYQRQARINVDGLQFAKEKRGDRQVLKDFFDVDAVIDPARVAYNNR